MSKESENSKKSMSRFLTFFVNDEKYGLDISHVKEIIASMKITSVPKTPKYIKGVINLRGSVIPIIDIRLKFALQEREHDMNTAIIINEIDSVPIGFVVDRVEDVLSIDRASLTDAPRFGSRVDTSFIEKVAEVNKNVIMILNLKKIFEQEELVEINKMEQSYESNLEES